MIRVVVIVQGAGVIIKLLHVYIDVMVNRKSYYRWKLNDK